MTAEEYIINKETGSNEEWILFSDVEELMIDYAKLKCQELLEIVAEKAKVIDVQTFEVQDTHDLRCDYRLEIDKDSILNAVDLDSFIV